MHSLTAPSTYGEFKVGPPPNTYAYSLRQDACPERVGAWLERHSPAFEKSLKIEANGCIKLSGEFQNQITSSTMAAP